MPKTCLTSLVATAMTAMATGAAAIASAAAQPGPPAWPARPLTMVVTFAAGTSGDVVGRILATRIGELLGQSVVVENVPGGGGVTGANRIAKAPPDGYQFLFGTAGTQAITQSLYKNPLYNSVTDFAPVSLTVSQPIVLLSRRDLPAVNLQEFIAYTKANQSRMSYGSGGNGTANHLACAMLNTIIGVSVTHVPYRSTSPIQDLVGGRIDYTCNFPAVTTALIESKQINALAALSKIRSPSLPALPTADEQGVHGIESPSWNAVFLPKGTPAPIVQKLHDAVSGTLDTPAVQARLREVGASVFPPNQRAPELLQRLVESEIEKWAPIVKAAGVQAE